MATSKHRVVARLGFAALLIVTVVLAAGMRRGDVPRVTVLTWNIFDGVADFTGPPDMEQLWHGENATRFGERADSIAQIIAEQHPHIICLQEVAHWRGLILLDLYNHNFLAMLQQRLVALGLHYDIVGMLETINFYSQFDSGGTFPSTLRWRENVVILARQSTQIEVSNVRTRSFDDTFTISSPSHSLEFQRGWIAADISYRGKRARYVCTHLEPRSSSVRQDQAAQLIDWLSGTGLPVIVMGDMSSLPASAVYTQFTNAGYQDAWAAIHGLQAGPTCCQSPDLMNSTSELDKRNDYVFLRGALTPVSISRVGQNQSDRTPGGLWPSDHAGLVAHIGLE